MLGTLEVEEAIGWKLRSDLVQSQHADSSTASGTEMELGGKSWSKHARRPWFCCLILCKASHVEWKSRLIPGVQSYNAVAYSTSTIRLSSVLLRVGVHLEV